MGMTEVQQQNSQFGDLERVLIPEERIRERVSELAADISRDYADRDLLVVGVLRGCFIFIADLIRALSVPCSVDFLAVESYGDATVSSGVVRVTKDLEESISGRHVLIVEDIVDSGRTLHYLLEILAAREPASLEICTLLDKPARREAEVSTRYLGFSVDDAFVVGYGLDFAQKYRGLPCIGVLKAEIYGGS
jgi:hypoxanthine phosphoribosyltransferase